MSRPEGKAAGSVCGSASVTLLWGRGCTKMMMMMQMCLKKRERKEISMCNSERKHAPIVIAAEIVNVFEGCSLVQGRGGQEEQEVGGAKPLAPGAKLISAAFILSSIPEK